METELDRLFFISPVLCEQCGTPLEFNLKKIFILINYHSSEPLIACHRCDAPGYYWIPLDQFLENPVDWLAQLNDKRWVQWPKIMKVFSRLRDYFPVPCPGRFDEFFKSQVEGRLESEK